MNESGSIGSTPLAGTGEVCVISPAVSLPPIRFPHIPSRDLPPLPASSWFHHGQAAVRVDGQHPPAGERAARVGIPGIRSPRSEAEELPLAPESGNLTGTGRLPAESLLAMNEQLRRRLLDFGNLLAASDSADRQLEKGFETVCRCYSQLSALIREAD